MKRIMPFAAALLLAAALLAGLLLLNGVDEKNEASHEGDRFVSVKRTIPLPLPFEEGGAA
ncbi:MAG: hypothetical protein IJM18_05585 [Clostridia bacterium]|nr:hypothetical protein [Clostridia bacterium]